MVMSVTPMVCITLAFWLGRSGLICTCGCCADTKGEAQIAANKIAKAKSENRFMEIMVLLLFGFGALCNAKEVDGKTQGTPLRQNLPLFTKGMTFVGVTAMPSS